MQESAEDKDKEAAVPGPALDVGKDDAAREEDTESQEAAGPAPASDMGANTRCVGVEETAPSRPEEDQREAKKSAPEEGEKEAASAPVE